MGGNAIELAPQDLVSWNDDNYACDGGYVD